MQDEIWYREELIVLLGLVERAIQQQNPSNVAELIGLGGLHIKLEKAIATAPSMRTPKGTT
jgi:hypothetical protein